MPTESQLRDAALRLHVRQRIASGQLLTCVPNRIEAGYGSGHVCVACDQLISHAHIEYEIQDEREGSRLRFHFGCHAASRSCAPTAASAPLKALQQRFGFELNRVAAAAKTLLGRS